MTVSESRHPCRTCGAETRFSHEEYAGGNLVRVVYVCRGCGIMEKSDPRPKSQKPGKGGRARKPLPNQGPPENPVLSADLAEQLKRLLSDDG